MVLTPPLIGHFSRIICASCQGLNYPGRHAPSKCEETYGGARCFKTFFSVLSLKVITHVLFHGGGPEEASVTGTNFLLGREASFF